MHRNIAENKCFTNRLLLLGVLLLVLQACAQDISFTSPKHYNLNAPKKYFLPESLTEVSGISFNEGDPAILYAVQDELGRLYYFRPGVKSGDYSVFGKHGDYEEVSIAKGTIIILRSNGTLLSFPLAESRESDITTIKTWEDLIPKGEYESLYADPETGVLYVLCKRCKQDKNSVSGYTLQLTDADSIYATGQFSIDTRGLELRSKKKTQKLRPSAMAKNPLTGEWFVVAAFNKLLLVLDKNWKVIEQHHLDPGIFRQPEGMAFDRYGNLFISNEGDDLNAPTLLRFDKTTGKK